MEWIFVFKCSNYVSTRWLIVSFLIGYLSEFGFSRYTFTRDYRLNGHVFPIPLLFIGGTGERAGKLCSDRLPKSAKCVFFQFPLWFPTEGKKEMLVFLLFKRYWLKIWIKYIFLNKSIEYRDPLHRNSALRKTNSISDIVM